MELDKKVIRAFENYMKAYGDLQYLLGAEETSFEIKMILEELSSIDYLYRPYTEVEDHKKESKWELYSELGNLIKEHRKYILDPIEKEIYEKYFEGKHKERIDFHLNWKPHLNLKSQLDLTKKKRKEIIKCEDLVEDNVKTESQKELFEDVLNSETKGELLGNIRALMKEYDIDPEKDLEFLEEIYPFIYLKDFIKEDVGYVLNNIINNIDKNPFIEVKENE